MIPYVCIILGCLIFGFFILMLAWYVAVYIKTLNADLTGIILLIELKCFGNPKVKTVAFYILLNEQIKEELKRISQMSMAGLIRLYDDKLTKKELLNIKKRATYLANKENEFLTMNDVHEILEKEQLFSFSYSVGRSASRYSSFEQQEELIGSVELKNMLQLLILKNKESSFQEKTESLFRSVNAELIDRVSQLFIQKNIVFNK